MLRRFIQKQGRYEKYVVSDLKIGYVMYIDIANKILGFLEGTFFKYVSTKLTKAEIMKKLSFLKACCKVAGMRLAMLR